MIAKENPFITLLINYKGAIHVQQPRKIEIEFLHMYTIMQLYRRHVTLTILHIIFTGTGLYHFGSRSFHILVGRLLSCCFPHFIQTGRSIEIKYEPKVWQTGSPIDIAWVSVFHFYFSDYMHFSDV